MGTTLTPRAPAPVTAHRPGRASTTSAVVHVAALVGASAAALALTFNVVRPRPAVDSTVMLVPETPVASVDVTPADVPSRGSVAPAADRARAPRPAPLAPRPPADGRDAPDPVVVRDDDRWAMFSTNVRGINVPVALSTDTRKWSPPVDALPQLPPWAERGRTWAPGVLPREDGFVLYFAARSSALGRQCIGAATAPRVDGPYTSAAQAPLVCQPHLGGSIDPQPFVDRDGAAYLLWKADANAVGRASQLFAQPLRRDGLAFTGDAVVLLTTDAPWEQPLIENPALLATGDGDYLLFYSGGWYASSGYATGFAVCRTPLGPCEKRTTALPVLASAHDEAGTGGASVMAGPAGDDWLVYHAWSPDAVGYDNGGARRVCFAAITWTGGELVVDRQA
jgi:beta-xylosidase